MKYVRDESLQIMDQGYKDDYPYHHIIIDNFLKEECLQQILTAVSNLDTKRANSKFIKNNGLENNKFAFTSNLGDLLNDIFKELVSEEFIDHVEKLTGIKDIIKNDTSLLGAGIHRITSGGYLGLHTDFNTVLNKTHGKIDRRINILIYLNKDWLDEYNGHLLLCDKNNKKIVHKIAPILNRCVIFNTTSSSVHGHPFVLQTGIDKYRESIAVYYYTKNTNETSDFEGNKKHDTIFYNINEFN